LQDLRVINDISKGKDSKGRLSRIEKAESRDRL
jgi:hypothetical protein